MNDTLKKIFDANNGYLETRHLKKRSDFYKLKMLVQSGDVVLIKRGLYRLASLAGNNELAEVCKIVQPGVICMFSAWYFYQLTTFAPSFYDLAIPSKMKRVLPNYPPINLYYWNEKQYSLGQILVDHEGETVKIFDLDKSVCDAIKFKNKIGEELSIEVLKNYLKRKDRNIDKLLKYSHQLRIENTLNEKLKLLI
ncbi:MAG: hypothetical protein JW729_06110 [Bacteroidales bacterium]|jgi:predicted transcriptional regulator of viral defense system|nr:hypothetical protein [Bacteroidales bacterium]